MEALIQSPCNNDCLIEPETKLCKGCFRTIDEIIQWIHYSENEKLQIIDFIKARKESKQQEKDE